VESTYEQRLYFSGEQHHTAIRPLLKRQLDTVRSGPELIQQFKEETIDDNALYIGNDRVGLAVSPLFNALLLGSIDRGKEPQDVGLILMNGVGLTALSGDKWAFSLNYLYNSSFYLPGEDEKILEAGSVSGIGKVTPTGRHGFGDYNSHIVNTYLAYAPNKTFNFQLGHGQHFIGDGYRSLLLSDNSGPYPYLRIQTEFWKIKYMNLFSMHYNFDLGDSRWSQFQKKYSSSHYLSMNLGKRLEIGLFESIVWQAKDSLYARNFDVNYLNPVLFFRPTEFSLGSPDNVLLGLNLSYKLAKKYVLYSQLLVDEFLLDELRAGNGWWANKFAVQGGVKAFIGAFKLQAEFNVTRPFTYSHGNALQSYSHANLPLAHPIGANFEEGVFIARYAKSNWVVELKANVIQYGFSEDNGNVGQDILKSNSSRQGDYGHRIGQGRSESTFALEQSISYLLNERNGMMVMVGVRRRESSQRYMCTGTHLFFGIQSSIFNQYTDY
jgi:hypothetical protein